jgi:hypothetical protein
MGIFDFFKPRQHADTTLGELVHRGGYWRGQISLGSDGPVPLLLAGGGAAPGESRLALARELLSRYPGLRSAIAGALFQHYEPYSDEAEDVPKLTGPDQVWQHVTPVHVRIEPLNRVESVEIAYRTAWDEEHTLGARFQNWALVELNGSVI